MWRSTAESRSRPVSGGGGGAGGGTGSVQGVPAVAPESSSRRRSERHELLLALLPPRLPRVQTDLLAETMHHYECGLLLFIIIVIK